MHDHALEAGDGGAAEALAEHHRAAPHGRDHHLAQEAELAVPHDRGGENMAVNITAMHSTPG